MDVLYGVRMTGPLAPYASGLAGELARLGFTEGSARGQLGLAAHLSRWLAAAGAGHGGADRRRWWRSIWRRAGRPGIRAYLTPKALAPLLGYLRGLGVAPQAGDRSAGDTGGGAAGASTAATCWPSVACRPKVARGYLGLGPPVRGQPRRWRRPRSWAG